MLNRPRVVAYLGAAALVLGGASLAGSMRWNVAPNAATPPPMADPQDAFKAEARSLLQLEQFARLDALGDQFSRTHARFAGGDWKSYRLIDALSCPLGGDKAPDQDWERQIAVLQRWHRERPDSMIAAIALADVYVCYGWKARGTGYSDSVTEEGWRLLHERMAPAEGILVEIGGRVPKTPDWYRAMINLGRVQSWERDRVTKLFDEGVALEPRYLHIYSAMARYLMPRWQGEEGDWERFADDSAGRIGGREGSVVYGHIAWQISKYYQGKDFYAENRVSWPRVKQGFIDREALYGASLRNLNAFCQLAGSAADRQTTRELLARIGDGWDADVWGEWKYFDGYRKWAAR